MNPNPRIIQLITWHKSRAKTTILIVAIACAVMLAILVHVTLGLLSIDIAVAKASIEDRKAATALIQFFAAQHPRVRIKTVLERDRLATATALDKGESQLAIVRSDAASQDGQTLVVLRRDAVLFIAPGGSAVDSMAKLRGETVALLDGRRLDARLLDLILSHFGIPLDSVRREVLTIDALTNAVREKRVGAVFVVAPLGDKGWLSLYTALREGSGQPRTLEVSGAAALAREFPVLDTIDVPKGTFTGSLPAPSDDITTLSVSHRLVAQSSMPDWLAGEITREILTGKPKLVALNGDLAGIEAPNSDEKDQALPIHPGTAAYLSGNLPSLSDQTQSVFYWLGLAVSAVASLSAAGTGLYQRLWPRKPPRRVMRLLELWLAARTADASQLDEFETETDALVADAIHDEAHGRTESVELRLATLLVSHVRETVQRRRAQIREELSRQS